MRLNNSFRFDHESPLDGLCGAFRWLLIAALVVLLLRANTGRANTYAAEGSAVRSVKGGTEVESSAELKVTRDARGRKVQVVDFSDAHIEGEARTPDGFMIQSRKSGRFKSLIEVRRHFRDHIKIHALDINTVPVTRD